MAEGSGDMELEIEDIPIPISSPIKYSDIDDPMIPVAIQLSKMVCEKYPSNYEYAAKVIKKTMDKKFGSYWHVVIGEGLSFEITSDTYLYIYYGGKPAVLMWKYP